MYISIRILPPSRSPSLRFAPRHAPEVPEGLDVARPVALLLGLEDGPIYHAERLEVRLRWVVLRNVAVSCPGQICSLLGIPCRPAQNAPLSIALIARSCARSWPGLPAWPRIHL
jgi:hypothetical protein